MYADDGHGPGRTKTDSPALDEMKGEKVDVHVAYFWDKNGVNTVHGGLASIGCSYFPLRRRRRARAAPSHLGLAVPGH